MGFILRWRRPLIAALIIMVVTICLSLTSKVRGKVLQLDNLVSTVLSPAAYGLTAAGHAVASGVGSVQHLQHLEQQNQQLKQELLLFNSMKLELNAVLKENGSLQGLLQLDRGANGAGWKLAAASVIGRNPDNWFDTVTIGKGSRSGIRVGMAVIVPQGVVGRVIGVGPSTASVMLALDPSSSIGAMDLRSASAGILQGTASIQGDATFQLFSRNAQVAVGDTVVTSGLSQYYPKGLLLGQVINVQRTNFGMTQSAVVQPAVDFNALQTVMVVLSHPAGTSLPPVYGSGQ